MRALSALGIGVNRQAWMAADARRFGDRSNSRTGKLRDTPKHFHPIAATVSGATSDYDLNEINFDAGALSPTSAVGKSGVTSSPGLRNRSRSSPYCLS